MEVIYIVKKVQIINFKGSFIFINPNYNLRINILYTNAFLRLSYSVKKNRSLVKPFLITLPDGYLVDIYGLYPATWNDAKIIQDIITNDKALTALLKEGDYLILDRGFKDAEDWLKTNYKLETMLPKMLKKGQKQFTTIEANESRLCTKLRLFLI